MSSSLKNIVLVLAFVILLPISIYITLEIGSLNENEEMLESVYREQLDAVIYSVNQYSADVFDFYLKQLDYRWNQSNGQSPVDSLFLQQNLAIQDVIVLNDTKLISCQIDTTRTVGNNLSDSLFTAHQDLIERLVRYKETGYIKPEIVGSLTIEGKLSNIILTILGDDNPCLLFIDPTLFIEDLIAPKIQQIAGSELAISVRLTPTNTYVYGDSQEARIIQTGKMALLENAEISITLMDGSIQELIETRTKRNFIVLMAIILLVSLGIVLVVRNFKKELMLSQAKSDFVANVSHEIRTPLALISMFNETLMLDRIKDKDKKKEYFEIIHKEVTRLNKIVNKILSFSQINANKKKYHFESVCPADTIREILDSYSYHLAQNGFTYKIESLDTSSIKADKESLAEMLVNLIDNAMKYSDKTKEINIRSYTYEDQYIVEVSDKGMGISKRDQQYIFDKFYRVSTGDIHDTKGTGLGLSLVNEIMKAHGGDVEVESKVGKGSTFKLKFNK